MNKKLFTLLILAILAIVSIGCVYALDLGSDDSSQTSSIGKVTIDGIDFNIPDGFEEFITNNTKQYNRTVDGVPYFSTIKNYDNDNDSISIAVSKNPTHKATQDTAKGVGGELETINGIEGYLDYHPKNVTKFKSGNLTFTLTIPPYYSFAYSQDDKLVVIVTTDKDYLSEVLIEEPSFFGIRFYLKNSFLFVS